MLDFLLIAMHSCFLTPLQTPWYNLGHVPVQCDVEHFADGETLIKWSSKPALENKDVVLWYQVGFPPSNVQQCSPLNSQLIDLFCAVRSIKENGAKTVNLVVPYLPYARQDKPGQFAQTGQLDLIVTLAKSAGASQIITCDIHNQNVIGSLPLPVRNISGAPFWYDFLKSTSFIDSAAVSLQEVVIASPDEGGMRRVRDIAGADFPFVTAQKKRIGKDTVQMIGINGDVTGKVVVLCDDIIDTAGTAIKACDLFLKHGATKVIGCFTHGVLSANAVARIQESSFSMVFIAATVSFASKDLGSKITVVRI